MLYAIGDIHGEYDMLLALYEKIRIHSRGEASTIVFLGDYVDRGQKSKQVLDFVMTEGRRNFSFVCLKGNHEQLMTEGSDMWLINGGRETKLSFVTPDNTDGLIPQKYIDWMKYLPTLYETEKFIFVHAGLSPGLTAQETSEAVRLWTRFEFLTSEYDWGKRVIHGHTPSRQVEVKPNRINIDTGAVFYDTLTAVSLSAKEPEFIQVTRWEAAQ